jgi:hypothetical protein
MDTKHTPGPWHYQERSDAYTHIVRNAEGDRIIVYAPQSTLPSAEANARLAAAAPDLLELLQEIYFDLNQRAMPDDGDAWYAKARAAIAKATGEQA